MCRGLKSSQRTTNVVAHTRSVLVCVRLSRFTDIIRNTSSALCVNCQYSHQLLLRRGHTTNRPTTTTKLAQNCMEERSALQSAAYPPVYVPLAHSAATRTKKSTNSLLFAQFEFVVTFVFLRFPCARIVVGCAVFCCCLLFRFTHRANLKRMYESVIPGIY